MTAHAVSSSHAKPAPVQHSAPPKAPQAPKPEREEAKAPPPASTSRGRNVDKSA